MGEARWVLTAWLALALGLAQALALAGAQSDGVSYVEGGEPGITILLDGVDLRVAQDPEAAVEIDPAQGLNLSVSLAPPQGVTWEIREIRVAVLLRGPDAPPPEALVRRSPTDASIPPGFTVFVNRTVELDAVKPLGAGLFLMRAEVADAEGAALYSRDFHVRVLGNPLLTVAGATAGVATAATGYGLWQIVKDLKEVYKARQRHRRRQEAEGRAMRLAAMGVTASDADVEGAIDIAGDLDKDATRMSRRRALAWAATGLGLGGVAVSWAQFMGRVPVDVGDTLVAAAGVAAAFLTGCLVLVSVERRLRSRIAASRARRIEVQETPGAGAQETSPVSRR